ncbi:Uncharacterised protein [Mycobacteroides abscessus subsp. abscessus]|nr:Uncharacterised protein [Mycobacteroides abscessus subsp. abscessus]
MQWALPDVLCVIPCGNSAQMSTHRRMSGTRREHGCRPACSEVTGNPAPQAYRRRDGSQV